MREEETRRSRSRGYEKEQQEGKGEGGGQWQWVDEESGVLATRRGWRMLSKKERLKRCDFRRSAQTPDGNEMKRFRCLPAIAGQMQVRVVGFMS